METEVWQELGRNRRLIVGLSLASGAVGLVPVPVAGDLGISLVRALLLSRVARRRGLELSWARALALAGRFREPSLARLAAVGAAVVGLRLAWRRLGRALLVLFRFDDVARTFLLGTYFEYYLVRHRKLEGPLSDAEVEQLRGALEQASVRARGHLVSALFRKAVDDMLRAGTFLPRTLWSLAQSALERDGEAVEQVVEQDVQGFFGRVTRLVEQELGAAGHVTLGALCAAFDAAWTESRRLPLADTGATR